MYLYKIRYEIIDEEIAYEQIGEMMFAYWQWSKPFILLSRLLADQATLARGENPDDKGRVLMYHDFENQIFKWDKSKRGTDKVEDDWKNQWQHEPIVLKDPITKCDESKSLKEWTTRFYELHKEKGRWA
jgi:hypothetical protein